MPVHVVLYQKPPVVAVKVPTLREFAAADARAYKLDVVAFLATIQCESQFRPYAVSRTADFGIAQIHLAAHPEITKAEAFDPRWSLSWAAKQWSEGRASEWSCFRIISGEGSS